MLPMPWTDITAKEAVRHGMVFDDLGFFYQLSSGELPSRLAVPRDKDTTLVTGHGSVLPFTTPKSFQRSTTTFKAHLPDAPQQQEANEAVSGVVPTRRFRAIQPLMSSLKTELLLISVRNAQSAGPPKVTEYMAMQEATISITSPTGSLRINYTVKKHRETLTSTRVTLLQSKLQFSSSFPHGSRRRKGIGRIWRENPCDYKIRRSWEALHQISPGLSPRCFIRRDGEAIARTGSIYGDPGSSFEPIAARRQLF